MARPRKPRRICFNPRVEYYKPRGIPLRELKEVVLSRDELEASRLCDLESLTQEQAAEKMGISQSTLGRVLNSARTKLSQAIVNGEAIRISS